MNALGIRGLFAGALAIALAVTGTLLLTRGPLPFAGAAIAGEGTIAPKPPQKEDGERGMTNPRLGF